MVDYHSHEEFRNRTRKLYEIKELGIDPYPAIFKPCSTVAAIIEEFNTAEMGDSGAAESGLTKSVTVGARLVLFRSMGKNIFAQIQEGTSRIQVMFNRDHTKIEGLTGEESSTKFLEKKVDLGDILGIEGHIFRTHKGELTIFAKKVTLLCKTLLPLPEKHSGLTDKEVRYRKRWLDLISHTEVMNTFIDRSRILKMIRKYFSNYDFLEVETPILTNTYGGAQAKPFLSHVNALDSDFYLRISLEIGLKKLLVGGMNRIYEIGKVFRNEGIDKSHNPEFTLLEAYAAFWDYNDMMRFVEELFEQVALKLHGKTIIHYPHPKTGELTPIDLKAPWRRISMKDSIEKYAGFSVDLLSDEELIAKLAGKVDLLILKSAPRGILIAKIFEEFVESHLIDPHHITDHPIETTPLCKLHRAPQERSENIVERFESFILCSEICNAYSELNDPVLQRSLLEEQNAKRLSGDEEANPLDEDFLEAICQGMPPAAGIGIGIDRMVMLLTGATSIRDVIFFPLMKEENND